MINTILFDLDGTLSTLDDKDFFRSYLKMLAPKFSHIVEPQSFIQQMLASTEVMKNNVEPAVNNMESFFNHFNQSLGLSQFITWPIFMEFYQYDFPQLRDLAKPVEGGRQAVETALAKGFHVAIASNAVLPKVAMEERLRWADIHHLPIAYLPSIEDMHYCKPQVEFFQELLLKTGKKPEECLMVGDDPVEDMVAGKLGIKTFLIDKGGQHSDLPHEPHYRGTMNDLVQLIQSL